MRMSLGSYGPKTVTRVKAIIQKWDSQIMLRHPMPPLNSTVHQILVWTLLTYGFSLSDPESTKTTASLPGTVLDFHVEFMKPFTIAYLGQQRLVISGSDASHSLPLRFCLACIYPEVFGTDVPQWTALPNEVIVYIMRFINIDQIGALACCSRNVKEACDSEEVWKYIYSHLSDYTNCPNPTQTGESPFRELVKRTICSRNHLRMYRFSRTIGESDWGSPAHVWGENVGIRPAGIRHSRYFDEVDLF